MLSIGSPVFHLVVALVLLTAPMSALILICTDPARPRQANARLRNRAILMAFIGLYLSMAAMLTPILVLIKQDFTTLLLALPLSSVAALAAIRVLDISRTVTEKTVLTLTAVISGLLIGYLCVAATAAVFSVMDLF